MRRQPRPGGACINATWATPVLSSGPCPLFATHAPVDRTVRPSPNERIVIDRMKRGLVGWFSTQGALRVPRVTCRDHCAVLRRTFVGDEHTSSHHSTKRALCIDSKRLVDSRIFQ